MADARLDADRLGLLPGQGRRRRRRAEGHDEGAAGARRTRPRRRRARAARPRLHRRAHRRLRGAGGRSARRPRWEAIEAAVRPDARRRSKPPPTSMPRPKRRHRLLRHGHHPAPPRHRERAADRQPAAAARQYRPAGRRHLPAARPFQRAGRPHRRHHRDPDRGVPRRASSGSSASSRRASRATTRSRRCEAMRRRHGPRRSSASAATSPSPCPTPTRCFAGMRKLDLAVHIATKLNRSHLLLGAGRRSSCPAWAAPSSTCRRPAPQSVTVEDSMSMVHASRGTCTPASDQLRSEPAIIAGMALATLPQTPGRLGRAGRRLRPHPRQDRGGVPGLPRLQRPRPPSPAASGCTCRPSRARLADAVRQGQLPGLRRGRGGSARGPAPTCCA